MSDKTTQDINSNTTEMQNNIQDLAFSIAPENKKIAGILLTVVACLVSKDKEGLERIGRFCASYANESYMKHGNKLKEN